MISIIIPVYNTPPCHLKKCLESITRAKYQDVEIILINDGSDDRSCREYLNRLQAPNLRIYSQSNKGVSAARNLGIQKAKGDYIAFVDADDEITSGFLEKASKLVLLHDLDIIFGSIQFVPDTPHLDIQGSKTFIILQDQELEEVKKSILEKITHMFPNPVLGTPCARLYRASVCRETQFNENIRICEDQIFNLYALEKSKRIGIYPAFWYKYYQNSFSAMHNMNGRQDLYPYYKCLKQYSENCVNSELCKWIDARLLGYTTGMLKQIFCSDYKLCQKITQLKYVLTTPLFSQPVRRLKWTDKEINTWKKAELLILKCMVIFFNQSNDGCDN